MYGNCKICGKRFGTDGNIWYEPCKHMKSQEQVELRIKKWINDDTKQSKDFYSPINVKNRALAFEKIYKELEEKNETK